jgi:F0F1-type ATP synthase membrane subunit b/b'
MEGVAFQYGALGILVFLLSFFAWNQFKALTERNAKLEEKVDTLQKEMVKLIVEEKDRLSTLVNENTKALNELRTTIVKYLLESNHHEE